MAEVMYVEYMELGEHGEPLTIRISEEEAIARQRMAALRANNYGYESDQDALEDFLVVHWAYRIKDGLVSQCLCKGIK